jgi:hypothetical protein
MEVPPGEIWILRGEVTLATEVVPVGELVNATGVGFDSEEMMLVTADFIVDAFK